MLGIIHSVALTIQKTILTLFPRTILTVTDVTLLHSGLTMSLESPTRFVLFVAKPTLLAHVYVMDLGFPERFGLFVATLLAHVCGVINRKHQDAEAALALGDQ